MWKSANLRAAWSWAVAQRMWAELRPLLTGLGYWFDIRNLFQEAVGSYAHVAAAARATRPDAVAVGEPDGEREIIYGLALALEGWHSFPRMAESITRAAGRSKEKRSYDHAGREC